MADTVGDVQFEVQNICVGNIDPMKLIDKLEFKFQSQFEVNVRTQIRDRAGTR